MTASLPNRNIVIASVNTDGQVVPVYIKDSEEPQYRENGGDLRPGDIWFDPSMNIYYHYDGEKWVPTGGQKLFDIIIEDVKSIREIVNQLQADVHMLKMALHKMEEGHIDIITRLNALEQLNLVLKGLLAELEDKMIENNSKIKSLEDSNTQLQGQIVALDEENTFLRTRMDQLESRLALLEGTTPIS